MRDVIIALCLGVPFLGLIHFLCNVATSPSIVPDSHPDCERCNHDAKIKRFNSLG
jgi:hypothetical protein